MVEINISHTLPTLCRLCLKTDDFMVNIFDQLDSSVEQPIIKTIFDLYQIKIEKQLGMPNHICHQCLYLTESFLEFRKNVKNCELKLQSRNELIEESQLLLEAVKPESFDNRYDGINGFRGFIPDENCEITVVNPNQEYESSDDCFSLEESDNEYSTNQCINGVVSRSEITSNEHSSILEKVLQTQNSSSDNLNEQKNTFLCQYCDMAFTAHMDCNEHESRHDAANPFICHFCPFRAVNRQVLIYHIKESHNNDRPYVCALCNKGFCRRSDLKKHTIVHTGVRPFSCSVCTKSFSRNTNLTKHMRIHTGVKPHVCQRCPRSFTTTAELLRHQRTHTEVKPHKCCKCSASFTRKDKLQKHYLAHLNKESESMNEFSGENLKLETFESNLFHETNPDVVYKNCENIKFYQKQHSISGENVSVKSMPKFGSILLAAQLQISQAQSRSGQQSSKPNLKLHVCNMCSRSFTRKREYQRHQALHLDSLYKCKLCGKNFNRKDKLFRHEEIHHSEQYNCNQCNISFSKLEALQMHIKIHELHKSVSRVDDGSTYYNQSHDPPPMALGFYSEIKPEE